VNGHRSPQPTLERRRAGVLLHPTSLPSGDFGADAWRFIDLLAECGLSVWQMLPLGPTHEDLSPYHALSVHAFNPLLINPTRLAEWGWIPAGRSGGRAAQLAAAYDWWRDYADAELREEAEAFFAAADHWLGDYALFGALREREQHRPWWQWSAGLRERDPVALAEARRELASSMDRLRFEQFVAARQWQALRAHADERGVRLFGDMPIFVAHDSADVWARPDCFRLDAAGQPTVVAGVPPDYFSATGQRWGNPLYDWERLAGRGFDWWIERVRTELARFDLVRLDHFRGFEACWEIPASARTAIEGQWRAVPGASLFDALRAQFATLPFVAEDLGYITPAVHALRERYALPGMLVLQFAFDGSPDNPYAPHRHRSERVVYTGTHDNDTTRSWFEGLDAQAQLRVVDYLGFQHEPMPWPMIRAALASVAQLAVIPMQDLLGLGVGHRMNTPGTTQGNWKWRFEWSELSPPLVSRLRHLVALYGR
jgi:4-alpha-glucanotransferase